MAPRKSEKNQYKKDSLNDIKNKLDIIKNVTNQTEKAGGGRDVNKCGDPFIALKLHILNVLDETKKCIREKDNIQKYHGNNIDAIKRGNIIYNNMKNIDMYLKKLEEILNKQMKQKNVFSSEEMNDKQETFSILKKQVYDCKKLSNFDAIKPTTIMDFNEFKNKEQTTRPDANSVTHDEEDMLIINRWKERDKQFNDEILEIGEVIDKIGDNAEVIAKKANQQNELIINIQEQTEKAHDNVVEANIDIKKVMNKKSKVTWCCRISLIVTFLILVTVTLSILVKKFIRA